jgi:hypothetical protein
MLFRAPTAERIFIDLLEIQQRRDAFGDGALNRNMVEGDVRGW